VNTCLDGDIEQQQKLFHKSKQKIIQSAPVAHERATNLSDEPTELDADQPGQLPVELTATICSFSVGVLTRVQLVTPVQGNYQYCLWQLGTLQLLVRSSIHGLFSSSQSNGDRVDELITCHAKLEYQPQFGFEQITDKEYRALWLESYLRHGAAVLLGTDALLVCVSACRSSLSRLDDACAGRINVFTQQVLKVDKLTYENLQRNLAECQIEYVVGHVLVVDGRRVSLQHVEADQQTSRTSLRPANVGAFYDVRAGGHAPSCSSLEANSYLLSSPLNDDQLHLYRTATGNLNE
jgi:hypothetical protein